MNIHKLYSSKQYSEIIEYYKKSAINDVYISDDLKLYYGLTLFEIGEIRKSLICLEQISAHDKFDEWKRKMFIKYLALCYYSIGDYNKCAELLKGFQASAINNLIDKDIYMWKLLLDVEKNYQTIETNKLNFHICSTLVEEEVNMFISKNLKSYDYLTSIFEDRLPKKVDIYAYEGDYDSIGNKLSYANPMLCLIQTNVHHTNGHELAHVVTHYIHPNMIKTRFIDEGIATFFDIEQSFDKEQVANFKPNININIKDLWFNFSEYDSYLAYKVAGLFIGYLIHKFSIEKMILFIANQTFKNARSIFGNDFDDAVFEFENLVNGV